jgi:hypothetical protein
MGSPLGSHSPSFPSLSCTPPNSPPNLAVSDLITPQNTWNFPLLLSIFNASNVKEIQKIPISFESSSEFIWTPSSNGLFSTKYAYRLISNPRLASSSAPLEPHIWKLLWKLKLNARLKLFLWKIAWTLSPQKQGLVSFCTFPLQTLFVPSAKQKLIPFTTSFLDAFLLELLGDNPSGL